MLSARKKYVVANISRPLMAQPDAHVHSIDLTSPGFDEEDARSRL